MNPPSPNKSACMKRFAAWAINIGNAASHARLCTAAVLQQLREPRCRSAVMNGQI